MNVCHSGQPGIDLGVPVGRHCLYLTSNYNVIKFIEKCWTLPKTEEKVNIFLYIVNSRLSTELGGAATADNPK